MKNKPCANAFYGLGVIGAMVYFIQTAPTATMVVFGIIKAFFWPAFIVFKALEFLKV